MCLRTAGYRPAQSRHLAFTVRGFALLTLLSFLPAGASASLDLESLLYGHNKPPEQPTLFVVSSEPNDRTTDARDVNKPCIVVATHGWVDPNVWPRELARRIAEKTDPNLWLCAWFDWRTGACVVNPTDAAEYARDKAGPMLARQLLDLSPHPRHVHLIGHSAGSWLISSAAAIIAEETDADIHLTFLDAYVPPFWNQNDLADLPNDPNRTCWAEHYYCRDLTLKVTERHLSNAHNVDITDITPGITDHEFPRYWYAATVTGQYPSGGRWTGKDLYASTDSTDYGFPRSLEAGPQNWEQSLELEKGNKPIVLRKPEKSLSEVLDQLFGRKED